MERIALTEDLNYSLKVLGTLAEVGNKMRAEEKTISEPFDKGRQILSDVLIHTKYARHIKELGRRETYDEMVNRREAMDLKRWPWLANAISWAYGFVRAKKVFPSMRSFQFAGPAIEVTNSRMFNCCYLPINSVHSFSETMFLLLGGSGVGYSVQDHHIAMLPTVKGFNGTRSRRYLIQDSIEGWADAVKVLMRSAFEGRERPRFDFSSIRKKGSLLVTSGGRAPGPEPLKVALNRIECILERAVGRQLTPLECHDILCFEADAVYAGGIRRAAMISFFSPTNKEMLFCKVGIDWLNDQPQRQRANNSAVLVRGETSEETFYSIMEIQKISLSGEPGIYWTNDREILSNPCVTDDTIVRTSLGSLPVRELIGKKFDLIVDGKLVPVKSNGFFSTGTKEVFEITTSNSSFNATENHLIMTTDNWKPVKDLVVGSDSVLLANQGPGGKLKLFNYVSDEISFKRGYLVGSCYGDGYYNDSIGQIAVWENSTKDFESLVNQISDCVSAVFPKQQKYADRKAYYFNQHGQYKYEYNSSLLKDLVSTFFSRNKELDIFALYQEDVSFRTGFLKGLFDCDGSVQGLNTDHGSSIRLSSINLNSLKIVQQMLNELAIVSTIAENRRSAGYRLLPTNDGEGSSAQYFCQAAHELIISRTAMLNFQKHINFCDINKQLKLAELLNSYKRRLNCDPTHSRVLKIESKGIQNVYDITVDTSNGDEPAFSANGVIVHNCVEASLPPFVFCNLTEINMYLVRNDMDFLLAATAASIIGTLQASYTDFHYLRPCWREATERDALIGVGMTGLAQESSLSLNFDAAARQIRSINECVARLIGINPAARTTLIKPSGTTSSVLGCSSGIHDWHDHYYVRRIRLGKSEPIVPYLEVWIPDALEPDVMSPDKNVVLTIPIKAPPDAIIRTDTHPLDLLEREKYLYEHWVKPGHREGVNTHSISITVSYSGEEQYKQIVDWMWNNRDNYAGISLLEVDNTVYPQLPFESITEERYYELLGTLNDIYLDAVSEEEDQTDLAGEAACAGGACAI